MTEKGCSSCCGNIVSGDELAGKGKAGGMRADNSLAGADSGTQTPAIFGWLARFSARYLSYWSICVLVGGLFLALGYAAEKTDWTPLVAGFRVQAYLPLYALAYLFSGYLLFLRTVKDLRRLRVSYPFLMVTAGLSAFALGSYEEGALILILMSAGEWLEDVAGRRFRNVLALLYQEIPKEATLATDSGERRVAISEVKMGDILLIRSGEVIPVDGRVIDGMASVDVSSVKGEYIPELVKKGSSAIAGSVCLDGVIYLEAQGTYEESTVSRLYKAVAEATREKGNYARFFERFSSRYAVLVVLLACAFFLIMSAFMGWDARKAFYGSLVFLVVSCPCAFVLSTPIATATAMAVAGKRGVLIRGGSVLERLSTIKVLALDKTGTLTAPELSLSKIELLGNVKEAEVLSYAVQLEASSNHPIARAVRSYAKERGIGTLAGDTTKLGAEGWNMGAAERITDIKYHVGGGVEGRANGKHICIGSVEFASNHHKDGKTAERTSEDAQGGAVRVVMYIDDNRVATFSFAEKLREGARELGESFKKLGIAKTVILSGDRRENVEKLSREVGIEERYAELKPEEKLEHLRRLKKLGATAMVGDGINDSAVLAGADVGIAINTIGNDLVLQNADVVVTRGNLLDLQKIFQLSKRAVSTIKMNTAIALVGKFFFALVSLILAGYGLKSLWIAILGDDGLTLLVIMNSLRLLRLAR